VSDALHPLATHHLPPFITAPGQSDFLMNVMIVFAILIVLFIGNLYLHLHALPERLAHGVSQMHFEIVAILALLALFTHNTGFWIAALILAFVRVPDFHTPLERIAQSVAILAGAVRARSDGTPETPPATGDAEKATPAPTAEDAATPAASASHPAVTDTPDSDAPDSDAAPNERA